MDTTVVPAAQFAPGEQLRELLPKWRRRLDPGAVPGLLYGRKSPAKKHVSQEDVAHLIGVSTRWYANLERGEAGPYSIQFLDQVAAALRLSREERAVLYMLAAGHEPDRPRAVPVGDEFAGLRAIVAAQPWPAYVSDDAWDCQFSNELHQSWFPHLQHEPNIMLWPFLYAEAKLQLVNWERDWARPMLAQLRAANARHPDNVRLQEIIRRVLAGSADARRIWEEKAEVHLHPDGDRRLMHVPHFKKPRVVEIIALTALRAAGFRLMMLIPVDEMKVPS
ncbi:helix-turn-helix domain-containing protein [Dactylosporangium sp. NPDC050688]|uniref:helix-turn-helix domain-containing protein n=1 Tax=Dactylosporangium sp. NPDC050688 TaxID=3157217 RepID=UPI0033F7C15B